MQAFSQLLEIVLSPILQSGGSSFAEAGERVAKAALGHSPLPSCSPSSELRVNLGTLLLWMKYTKKINHGLKCRVLP